MDNRKRNIVAATMVAMFLAAVEGTVVTTAVPTIVKDLNGFELISWIFSLYLLTSAISTPIYGKLSDLYGRKNILSIGIVIFLAGSSLCGLSQNMYQLIAFRALQGLGAGAIFTVTYTIIGDIFSLAERAKVQGWMSGAWGVASLAGPFLGGFMIDYLSWNWIFFINVPFGILSIVLLQRNLEESFEKKKHKIDYAGAAVLSAAIIVLLNGVLAGEKSGGWLSAGVIISVIAEAVLLAAFFFIEKRASEPIIPFEIFTKTNTVVNTISFMICAVLIGVDVYMPLYVQSVLGFSAMVSGLSVAPMSIAWLLSSVFLAKAIPKYGEKAVIGLSVLVVLAGSVLLPTLGLESPLGLVIVYSFLMGLGFGGAFTTLTIVVQASVDYNKRGAATASNSLVRTIGQTIGISVFGTILNLNIVRYFNNIGITDVEPNNLYSSASANSGLSFEHIRASLDSSLHVVFIAFIFLSAGCMLLSFALSNGLKEQRGGAKE